jgi:hypothetical protein
MIADEPRDVASSWAVAAFGETVAAFGETVAVFGETVTLIGGAEW